MDTLNTFTSGELVFLSSIAAVVPYKTLANSWILEQSQFQKLSVPFFWAYNKKKAETIVSPAKLCAQLQLTLTKKMFEINFVMVFPVETERRENSEFRILWPRNC